MSNRYLGMGRPRRPAQGGFQFTSKRLLALLALVAMIGSACYWWGIQKELTGNWAVALAYTAILVLAPPSLVSFLIPWSPAGMLLQKINARTWGYAVVTGSALVLIYYSFILQYQWWSAQPVAAGSGIVLQQVLIGLIGFIGIPALLWTPVSSDELVEQIRQAHLVRRYELQTQADLALLRSTLMRAQEKALVGFANLSPQERQELAAVMHGLVRGIDQTIQEVAQSVKAVSGASVPFTGLGENRDIRGYLEYITDSLLENPAPVRPPASQRQEQPAFGPPNQQASFGTSRDSAPAFGSPSQQTGFGTGRDAAPGFGASRDSAPAFGQPSQGAGYGAPGFAAPRQPEQITMGAGRASEPAKPAQPASASRTSRSRQG
ncbi:MAG TPA: hypothetical protein VGE07_16125 [Herpetosiphonaceae bacterium]